MSEVTNKNMLNPTGFTFTIDRIPSINFFVQSVTLPGITLEEAIQPTPLKLSPQPGDRITYSELEVRFKVAEDLSNYIAVYSWITGLGFPESFEQYKQLADNDANLLIGSGIRSDCTLTINTSSRNPAYRVTIQDAFPISLTPIELNTVDAGIEYVDATVSFRFELYKFFSL